MSNANPIDELVTMVSTLRSFEAAQRTLTSIDQTSEKLTTAAQNA
ncbi:MAG: flagellar basal body rod C-terminal domain-containing protein [Planctomycetota bacterium]